MFWNETGFFLEYMLNQNLKIYYITSSPKHSIDYTEECFEFFKNYKTTRVYSYMPDNLKKLRELQSDDLIYFYDNLLFESLHTISKIKNNKYYYDMLIVVKSDFDLTNFYKIY